MSVFKYYIKRPLFGLSLLFCSSDAKLYSKFVMDLIEADQVEYKPSTSYSHYKSWYVKGTSERILLNKISLYISWKLSKMETAIHKKEQLLEVTRSIDRSISAMTKNHD